VAHQRNARGVRLSRRSQPWPCGPATVRSSSFGRGRPRPALRVPPSSHTPRIESSWLRLIVGCSGHWPRPRRSASRSYRARPRAVGSPGPSTTACTSPTSGAAGSTAGFRSDLPHGPSPWLSEEFHTVADKDARRCGLPPLDAGKRRGALRLRAAISCRARAPA
jgi:hypothetical protein